MLAALSLSLLVATVASCGGSGGPTPVEAGPVALVRLLDADTPIVGHVDMDGLRQSPYYSLIRDALMSALSETEQGELGSVLTVLDRTDHIVIGGSPALRQAVVLLRGSFESNHLEALGPPDGQFAHRTHQLRGDTRSSGVVTADTMILGATESVLRALDRLDGLAPATGPTLAGFSEAAGRVQLGERDVSAVVLLTEEIRQDFASSALGAEVLQNGLSAGVSADARNGIRLSGFFAASSEGAVHALAAELRAMINAARGEAVLAMLGLSALLDQIEITERGTDLLVEFHLDDQQVRDLLQRFGPLLQVVLSSL
jgi:hypothetical protein